jgi:hypothetical protein
MATNTASMDWGRPDEDMSKLDGKIASFINKQMAGYQVAKYAQTAPPPQQQGLAAAFGNISSNTWYDTTTTTGTSTTTLNDTDAYTFKQLSKSFKIDKDEYEEVRQGRAVGYAKVSRGPYLNRLRDEITGWHGDPLERG